MKRFRFPLQPVSVLRAHREMRAREAFAAAVQAYLRADGELGAIRVRVAQFEAALEAGRRHRFSAAAEAQALAAYTRERSNESNAERAAAAALAAMEQRRDEYLVAHRDMEMVARLELKARAAHRLENSREEQAEFDDVAGRRSLTRKPLFSV